MDKTFPLKSRLRADLVRSARLRNRRSGRIRSAATAMAIVVVLVVGLFTVSETLSDSPASASVLSVIDDGHTVTVRLKDLRATPQEIVKELRSKHVKVTTQTVKVAPSSVGRFVSLQAKSADFLPVDGNSAFTAFRVAKKPNQLVTIGFGVSAGPGEMYGAFTDAYLPGNPLHCSGLWAKRTPDIVAFVHDHGLQATYRAPDAGGGIAVVDPQKVPELFVTNVDAVGTDVLNVTLNSEPQSPFDPSQTSGSHDCQ